MCIIRWTSWNSHRGEGVIISITIPFFLNIFRMSLLCQLSDMVVNSDSFIAEITNGPKETVDFFLWFSIQTFCFYGSEFWLPPWTQQQENDLMWKLIVFEPRRQDNVYPAGWGGDCPWCRRLREPLTQRNLFTQNVSNTLSLAKDLFIMSLFPFSSDLYFLENHFSNNKNYF